MGLGSISGIPGGTLLEDIESIVQESAFRLVEEGNDFALYWYGATGECPYSIELDGTDYVLMFNYTY